MSVNVEWRTGAEIHQGLVAEGTYLWDAAKRLGVRLPAECQGRGECDTCAVVAEDGAALLSELTAAERERLSPERLLGGERLSCQAKVERTGSVVLRTVPVTVRTETTEETVKDFRKEFKELPLRKKLSTLAELEAATAIQTLTALAEYPITAFEKGLDLIAEFGRGLSRREREARRPAEHRAADAKSSTEGAGGS